MISKSTQLISKELQGIHIGDLHPLRGMSVLNTCDLF